MIRWALPKGRNQRPALAALRAAGLACDGLDTSGRKLQQLLPGDGVEVLLLKDWDLPLYVGHGIADCGIVGSDVLEEMGGGDLLVPARLTEGSSRLSLIGRPGTLPRPGQQLRLASKYPRTARRWLRSKPWGAEVFKLYGSVELGPILDLAEVALDIVQTGSTLRENDLVELEVARRVQPCLVVGRAAYQRHRQVLNGWLDRLEAAGLVELRQEAEDG